MKNKLIKILLPVIFVFMLLVGCHPRQVLNTVEQETQSFTIKDAETETQSETVKITETEIQSETIGTAEKNENSHAVQSVSVEEDGEYTSKEEVAEYIHRFGKLPGNYITKTKAKKLGWEQSDGNLGEVLPGMSIGGGPFGNNEEKLPEAPGREYYECDIDYHGGKRNAKRIVYSNDGLIFYTEDHYESFEQLY